MTTTATATAPDTRFVAYEYTSVVTSRAQESFCRDAYTSFGWTVDSIDRSGFPLGAVKLHLKRDRAIANKAELVRLQQQFEASLKQVDRLEGSKTTKAAITAYSVGIVGAAALAGAVFVLLAGHIFWMVVLGVIGLATWTLPYFLHRNITTRQTAIANEAIDREYDQMSAYCQQALTLA